MRLRENRIKMYLSVLKSSKTRLPGGLGKPEAGQARSNNVKARMVRRRRGKKGNDLARFKEMAGP